MKKSLAVLSVSALLVLAGCAPSGELASSNSESTPESISTSSVESASSVPEESSEEDPYSWPASSYETISIAEAKKVEEGTEVTVRGRIMRHLKTSSGYTAYLWLSDGEGISVYPPKSTTYDVKEGQLITVKGKYSVCKGLPEISEPTILETFDMPYNVPEDYVEGTSAIPELLALEVTPENVGKIYKTSAIVSKGNYNVYSFKDPFSDSSLQAYSQSNYSEYTFLDSHLDTPIDLYLQLGNPKVSNNTYLWRAIPLSYIGEHAIDVTEQLNGIKDEPFEKLNALWFRAGSQSLPTQSSSLSGATFSYAVDKASAASVSTSQNACTLSVNGTENFTLSATITYLGQSIVSTKTIAYQAAPTSFTTNQIEPLRTSASSGDAVNLDAVVLGGVFDNGSDGKRFNSYYVCDSTGSMQVTLTSAMASQVILHRGERVKLSGTFDNYEAAANSKKIKDVSILDDDYGNNDFPYSIPTKTFTEMYYYEVSITNNRSGDVFFMNAILHQKANQYATTPQYYVYDVTDTSYAGTSKNIYHSSNADFSYLDPYCDTPITFLMGIHDKKPVTSGSASDRGYYRYDIIDGFYDPVSAN